MGIIDKNPKVTKVYKVNMGQLKELIAKDLEVPVDEINVVDIQKDISGPMDQYSSKIFDGITITHKPK